MFLTTFSLISISRFCFFANVRKPSSSDELISPIFFVYFSFMFPSSTEKQISSLGSLSLESKSIHCNDTTQKMAFSIKDFFSKCDQIRRKLRIWLHLLKKFLMENFIFCAVPVPVFCMGNNAHTQKFKTLKGCFNPFQPADKAFSFSHNLI